MSGARHEVARTPVEIQAVYKVIEAVTRAALEMALNTARDFRTAEMVALHATIPARLIAEGVDPVRAAVLARGIRVEVEVAEDGN
ncbi:MAG TPA: hypothetical protein VEK07_02685 [Polyangiaceae bacterium]|nr:hypothetical protein [Polyangiaceae bacterium]